MQCNEYVYKPIVDTKENGSTKISDRRQNGSTKLRIEWSCERVTDIKVAENDSERFRGTMDVFASQLLK